MSETKNNYGLLLNSNIKLHRQYFKEMVRLLGINCIYEAPRDSKEFDTYGELDTRDKKYFEPQIVGCIFQDHPDQKTMKKMGWVSELQEGSSIIHVPYDLPHLQVGALFTIPSGIDNTPGRKFRVIGMQTTMIYPASISCEIAPEYETVQEQSDIHDFTSDNFTVLRDLEDDD